MDIITLRFNELSEKAYNACLPSVLHLEEMSNISDGLEMVQYARRGNGKINLWWD